MMTNIKLIVGTAVQRASPQSHCLSHSELRASGKQIKTTTAQNPKRFLRPWIAFQNLAGLHRTLSNHHHIPSHDFPSSDVHRSSPLLTRVDGASGACCIVLASEDNELLRVDFAGDLEVVFAQVTGRSTGRPVDGIKEAEGRWELKSFVDGAQEDRVLLSFGR